MANKPESPTEPFKRALAHAARSLAETPDLEVVFSGDGPSLSGNRAVLPHPPRDMSSKEASPIRANALGGVLANLTAVLEQTIDRKGMARMSDRANAPIADVLALMVRERLTGDAPPDGARTVVDLFRAEVEAKAGPDLDRLMANLHDQAAFGKVARAILRDLDLGDADLDQNESGDEEEGEEDQSQSESDDGDGDGQTPEGASMEESDGSDSEGQDGEEQMVETDEDATER